MQPADWRRAHPDVFFLAPEEPESLGHFLTESGFMSADEVVVSAGKAGDGNMNCTVRVTTQDRSFIVKQARPWVEKYPQFEAPWDRALREIEFYQLTSGHAPVADAMPKLLHANPGSRLIVLEDLGIGRDYTGVYRGDEFLEAEVGTLAGYLSQLHGQFEHTPDRRGLANRGMRELNSRHIFFIPLQKENGLDLNSIAHGLQSVADDLIADARYVRQVHALAGVYLADGPHLLHGDFFPGSFLKTGSGPRVIDPEFAYFGRAEFDPAVFIAHLLLGRQQPQSIERFLQRYDAPAGHDDGLMVQFAGVEIMRRLIGYAQLPLGYGCEQRKQLLEISRQMVLQPDRNLLATSLP